MAADNGQLQHNPEQYTECYSGPDYSSQSFSAQDDSGQAKDSKPMNASQVLSTEVPRDRFELLSAYLDGELTACNRREVETWLEHDPTIQELYQRLLTLRKRFQAIPAESLNHQEDQFAKQIFAAIQRRRRDMLWKSAPIVAAVTGAWVGLWFSQNHFTSRFAQVPAQPAASIEANLTATKPVTIASEPVVRENLGADRLAISLDQPIIAFPGTALDRSTVITSVE